MVLEIENGPKIFWPDKKPVKFTLCLRLLSVVAKTTVASDSWAFVIHALVPLIIHPPSTFVAKMTFYHMLQCSL